MNRTLRPIADLARSLPADRGFALIPNRKLYELYTLMLCARLQAARLEKLSAKCPGWKRAAGARGCEAFLAAALLTLEREDWLAPGADGYVPAALKGLPASALRRLAAGEAKGIAWQRQRIVAPSLPLAAQLEEALAAAESAKKSREKKLILAFCGDPSENEKTLKKAMAYAGSKKLPVLFVVHAAVDTPEFAPAAEKYEFPGIVTDRNDAVAVYRVATESAAHARRGNGPTLIECRPWPLDQTAVDPITQMEAALQRRGIFSQKLRRKTLAACKQHFSMQ